MKPTALCVYISSGFTGNPLLLKATLFLEMQCELMCVLCILALQISQIFYSLCVCCILALQIPQIFYSLQDSVKAVLLGSVAVADWFEKGVPAKSFVEQWTLSLPTDGGRKEEGGGRGGAAVACDGRFLYVHGSFGLAKVGSGYGNTQKVLSFFFFNINMT